MKFITLISLFSLTLFVQCKKHSNRWLTGEFYIVDAESKEPVSANFKLRYYEGSLWGSEEKLVELGGTGDEDFFELERSVNRKDNDFKLEIYAGPFYGGFNWPRPDLTRNISKNRHNEMTIEMDRSYVMNLIFNNTSCYDETDSLWLVRPGSTIEDAYFFATGCVNEYQPPNDVFYTDDLDTATFISISKKNGTYDTLYHHYVMEHFTLHEFELNY
jgi:hypothetical protein